MARGLRTPSPLVGQGQGFAKHALRCPRRIWMQPNPWGAERGWGEGANFHHHFHRVFLTTGVTT